MNGIVIRSELSTASSNHVMDSLKRVDRDGVLPASARMLTRLALIDLDWLPPTSTSMRAEEFAQREKAVELKPKLEKSIPAHLGSCALLDPFARFKRTGQAVLLADPGEEIQVLRQEVAELATATLDRGIVTDDLHPIEVAIPSDITFALLRRYGHPGHGMTAVARDIQQALQDGLNALAQQDQLLLTEGKTRISREKVTL